MAGKRTGARWVRENWGKKISKQKESRGNGSRERVFFFLLNIEEGLRSNNIDKGKKREFRDERGYKEEDVGGSGEEGKRTEGREND